MILEDPGIVEQGLVVLDGNLRAGAGSLIDFVATDVSGGLVLVEIGRESEDELILRILDHHCWVRSQAFFLRRLYGGGRIDPFRSPRTIVLSHHFSPRLLQRIASIRLFVTPLLYRLLLAGNEPALYLETVEESLGLGEVQGAAPGVSPEKAANGAEVERLSPEELEAFYHFEHDRERKRELVDD